ncbi:oxygen-insensitive NADPH nitroreductase [Clostridium manihotivorum]|uniref:Oxygen-insensitive NADPH nitroreductase n=1 Tax=Clostridium manihotivorum TaxID=2320868 RepID=A0A3R5QWB7_9CLOT|nr:oxygen-insensitive NADPH nitroreductase [Clostridium manihotivorum]QAA33797.1 oxygen-insensitive NADPH nitroreductase [Clostridium manihotivorum]
MNDVINLLKAHKSVRKYKDKAIEEEKIRSIIEAAQSASTSSFIQAYTIISVENKENRAKIAKLGGDQKYIEECPLFLVFCADLNRHKVACDIHDVEMQEGYTESFIIATVDTALAAQNAMIAAESLGLGGVYIGGIRNNPNEISEILNIPTNVYPVFGMCLGYPDEDNDIKERLPMEVVFKKDTYTTDGDLERLKEYDSSIEAYYLDRTKGMRSDTWTGMMARMMSHIPRPHMKAFLEKHGFFMK